MELAAIDAVAPKAVETETLQPVEEGPVAPTPLARPKKLVEQKKAEPEKEKPREQPKKKPASAGSGGKANATVAAAAASEDHDGAFPAGALALLQDIGLLAAPLRRMLGGFGWGIEPKGAAPLAIALRLIGRASLPLGRLYEGHVNALRLVQRYGTPAQARAAASDAAAGLLFAVWNTEAAGEPPLTIRQIRPARRRDR